MDLKFIKYEKRNHIAYITFNRPERMNALHPPCHLEMDSVWDDFVADKSAWVAIVTGAGDKGFSAGNDLRWTAENRGQTRPKAIRGKGGFAGITARYDIYKPIIAAVNGFALGGGFEIALVLRYHHRRRARALRIAGTARRPDGRGGRRASPAAPDPAEDRDGHDADGQAYHRRRRIELRDRQRSGAAERSDPDGREMGRRNHGMLTAVGTGEQGSGDERTRTDGRSSARASITICSRSCSDRRTQWKARWHSRRSERPNWTGE